MLKEVTEKVALGTTEAGRYLDVLFILKVNERSFDFKRQGQWRPEKGSTMTGSSSRSLPRWSSLDEVVDYFDTHDMGGYLDHLHQVQVEVDIKRKRHLVAIDDDILARVGEVAKQRRVSSEELINTWLRERLLEYRR